MEYKNVGVWNKINWYFNLSQSNLNFWSYFYCTVFFKILKMIVSIIVLLKSFTAFFQAQVHRHTHNFREVQQCTLLSIKTGGCSEDCSYCPQSSRYNTGVKSQKLMTKDAVLQAAKKVNFFIYLHFELYLRDKIFCI